MTSKTSRADFEALVRRAGLTLSEQEITDIHQGWSMVEPLLERIRMHGRDRGAEPGHIFRPDVFGTEAA